MPDTPLYFHTITELAALIKSQQLSPVEVTRALLERIAQLDGRYKSYATVMADQALDAARVAERDIRARLSHKNFTRLSNASNLLGQSAKSSSAS
jgi:Asp-tRNA(Asn)/Glu-tRNA(Gln) amidotransferase A subunit family amidase